MLRSLNRKSSRALADEIRGDQEVKGILSCHRDHRVGAHVIHLTTLFSLMCCGTANLVCAQSSPHTMSLPPSCVKLATSSREASQLMQSAGSRPSATAYHSLGESFADINEFACSISAYELALKLDPHSWQIRQSLGLTL